MAKKGENYNDRELRIYGVPAATSREIKNIAAHLGVKVSDFMKPKVAEIAKSYPEHMRKPMQD